jgi:hypothetical protein
MKDSGFTSGRPDHHPSASLPPDNEGEGSLTVAGDTASFHERPSLDDVWRWAVLLAFAALLLLGPIHPHDLWWHLRSGQLAVEEGWISTVDRFSFTRSGGMWVNQSWLMQVALYGLYQLGGLLAIHVAYAAAITGGYAVLTAGLRRSAGTTAAMLAGSAAFLVGAPSMGVRPQAISFLCFGALIVAIELHRRGLGRLLRAAPLLFAFWVNAHGAFVFGGVVLGLYVLARTWALRRDPGARAQIGELWWIAVLSFAALALTPEGPQAILAYFGGFFAHGFDTIAEFQPLHIRELEGLVFLAVVAAAIVAIVRSGVRPAPDQLVSLIGLGLAALYAARFAPWFGFVLAPVLAAALAERLGRGPLPPGHRGRNALYLALTAALLVAAPGVRARVHGPGWISDGTPVAAGAELCRSAPDGARVFQDVGFASYQIFQCPRLQVFADPRIEYYSREHWDDFVAVSIGRYDWEAILERWGVTYVMVPSEGDGFRGLRAALEASGRWSEQYRDATAVVWSRRGPG